MRATSLVAAECVKDTAYEFGGIRGLWLLCIDFWVVILDLQRISNWQFCKPIESGLLRLPVRGVKLNKWKGKNVTHGRVNVRIFGGCIMAGIPPIMKYVLYSYRGKCSWRNASHNLSSAEEDLFCLACISIPAALSLSVHCVPGWYLDGWFYWFDLLRCCCQRIEIQEDWKV